MPDGRFYRPTKSRDKIIRLTSALQSKSKKVARFFMVRGVVWLNMIARSSSSSRREPEPVGDFSALRLAALALT